jgi:sigma-B regulation protein RsbU (phosphoserine phosphatase)
MSSRLKPAEFRGVETNVAIDGEERLVSLTILSRPDRLRLVRAAVSEAARASGCSETCTRDIVLAVDEACQNVIRHAYGGESGNEIFIDVRRSDEKIVLDVIDFAEPVDPSSIKPRSLEEIRPGGLGTHFINECMDEAQYLPAPPGVGNLLRMAKRIA